MIISGARVKCANCGMIYEKPPAEKVYWIGVPFTVSGTEFCPKCGSNAADFIQRPDNIITTTSTEAVNMND